jgi:ABC-type protease/lipase transport system fused ATPase/permease subunit
MWEAVVQEEVKRRTSSCRVSQVRPAGSDPPRAQPAPHPTLELRTALRSCSGVLVALAVITATLNVLYLTSSFFMLEVYDRVVPSRSVPTLIALALLALALFALHGFLDIIRTRVLIRVGSWLDRTLSGRVYDLVARLPLRARTSGDGLQPLRDLDQLRTFLSGLGPTALFDIPWMPFYLALCYLFHPLIGLTALVGSIILVTLTILTDILTRSPIKQATREGASRNALAEASRRNAEVLQAMGMRSRVAALWSRPTKNTWKISSAPSRYPGHSDRSPRCCVLPCNPRFSEWAAIWSSSRKPAPASSLPAQFSPPARSRLSSWRLGTGKAW